MRRLAALGAAAFLALPAAPARAAAPVALRSTVVLSGSSTASVRVTLAKPVALSPTEYFTPTATVTGARAWGFALLPDGRGANGRAMYGVRLPADEGGRFVYWLADGPAKVSAPPLGLPAGTYRLVLLTQGAGTVRFRLPGLPAGTTRLSPRDRIQAEISDVRPTGPLAPPSGVYSLVDANDMPVRRRLLAIDWYRSSANAAMVSHACFRSGDHTASYVPGCVGGESLGVSRLGPRTDDSGRGFTSAIVEGSLTLGVEMKVAGPVSAAGAVFVWLQG